MCFIPIPGIGYPDLSVPEKNWAHYIDSILLPGVMWEDTWDPEGILSTLPSIGTGTVSYTHLRAHETKANSGWRLVRE